MPFDEILRRSIDSLMHDLTSAVQAERDESARRARAAAEVASAAALAEAQIAAEQRGLATGREEGLTEGRRQGFHQGRQEGYESGKRDGFQAGKDAGFESGKAEGYRAGREEGRQENTSEGDAADRATSERLAEAMRALDRAGSLSEILTTLATTAGREASRTAVLLVRGDTLAGWRMVGFGEQSAAFEAPLAEGGIVAEAVRAGTAISSERSNAAAPPFAEPGGAAERLAVPIAIGGQVVAALYADRGPVDQDARPPRFGWRLTLEMLAAHAAKALEAVTAFRTAQLVADSSPQARPSGIPAPSEEEHAARRYARLLVSEIKLYHGAEVAAGRRERDLAIRLGGEITRARALYDQRASSHGSGTPDYFEEELVRTLADGDASLL